jgi:DNA-binding transcriptional regulator YiaG
VRQLAHRLGRRQQVSDRGSAAAKPASVAEKRPVRLIGAGVRFIRRVLGMTGQELAAAVEMDPATLSRWEHTKQEVGGWADKAIRMAAVLQLQDRAPGSSLHPEEVVTSARPPSRGEQSRDQSPARTARA